MFPYPTCNPYVRTKISFPIVHNSLVSVLPMFDQCEQFFARGTMTKLPSQNKSALCLVKPLSEFMSSLPLNFLWSFRFFLLNFLLYSHIFHIFFLSIILNSSRLICRPHLLLFSASHFSLCHFGFSSCWYKTSLSFWPRL